MPTKIQTHYDNLQIARNASEEVVRGAYRYLCQKWHPDKHPQDRENAERVTKLLNDAYRVLSDPEKRREHDQWIASQETAETGAADSTPRPDTLDSAQTGGSSHPLWRLGFMVLVVVFGYACVKLIVKGVAAVAERNGFVSIASEALAHVVLCALCLAICVYGYLKLFPPGGAAPGWLRQVHWEISEVGTKELFKVAFGWVFIGGLLLTAGNRFDRKDAPSETVTVAPSTPAPTRQPPPQVSQPSLNVLIERYKAENYAASIPGFRAMARQGNLIAAAYLCDATVLGHGVPKSKAIDGQCQEAAAAGIPLAMGIVAQDLLYGKQDLANGIELAESAARSGDARSIRLVGDANYLGWNRPVDKAVAIEHFRRAAEMGEIGAITRLGRIYALGDGVPADLDSGLALLRLAADQQYADAQYWAGVVLRYGPEEVRDSPQAFGFFEAAARQGFEPARYVIAMELASGEEVPKDLPRARKLLDANIASTNVEFAGRSRLLKSQLMATGDIPGTRAELMALLDELQKSPITELVQAANELRSSLD